MECTAFQFESVPEDRVFMLESELFIASQTIAELAEKNRMLEDRIALLESATRCVSASQKTAQKTKRRKKSAK